MKEPESHRRCVRLVYSDGSQFHLDATPATPDINRSRFLLETHGIDNEWAHLSVKITDEKSPNYKSIDANWPHSNPRGYAKWFRSRMGILFQQRREGMRLEERKASIEDIPEYRVRTPLQMAVQILKRHRDITYSGEPENKPISIIITTLSALAYNQEISVTDALYGILSRMLTFITERNGVTWVANPTDPLENFADKWKAEPDKKAAFIEWVESAKSDFIKLASLNDPDLIYQKASSMFGAKLADAAITVTMPGDAAPKSFIKKLFNAPHKEPLRWLMSHSGNVTIKNSYFLRNGFRWQSFTNDGAALPKHCDLKFFAETNVPEPYNVFWQVVNSGYDATNNKNLRGGYEEIKIGKGQLEKKETTLYSGSHTIECFIVKDGYCAAKSGPFIVNIR